MDDNLLLMSSIGSIVIFLSVFPALWISGRIILRNFSLHKHAIQIFLWLALGGLILTPIYDFLRYLGYVLSLVIPSLRNSVPISVFLGVGPYLVYSIITLILGVIVYTLSFNHAHTLINKGRIPLNPELQLGNWELSIVLLGVAGLVNQLISGIIVKFLFIYLPSLTDQLNFAQGLNGFWISWLIAFIILLGTLFIMYQKIQTRE
jgi:hypothetical protein